MSNDLIYTAQDRDVGCSSSDRHAIANKLKTHFFAMLMDLTKINDSRHSEDVS